MTPDVLVIGGGCAGLAAATALVEKGARVVVLEARGVLGGRARSWTDPASGDVEDNGQHLVLGCYDEFLSLARRTGGIEAIRFQPRTEVVLLRPGGLASTFRPAHLPFRLGLLSALLRLDGFRWRAIPGAAALLRDASSATRLRDLTVSEWLAARGQRAAERAVLWDPLAFATLNLDPETAPAALLAAVLRIALLRDSRASRLGFPDRGLDAVLSAPSRRFLEDRGGVIRTREPVSLLEFDRSSRFVAASCRGGARQAAGAAVLAVPPPVAAALLPGSISPRSSRELLGLGASPIVGVHLWFDRDVSDHAMAGLIGSPVHWVFDRARIGGGASPGYLALVTSAADRLASLDRRRIVESAIAEVRRFLPRARDARALRWRVVKEREATPRFTPRNLAARAGAATGSRNLALAGDWTDTGLPATLEGAAASGHRAASLLDRGGGW